ncbi:MAG: TIGR04076 family protein [Candidatus Thorarchaeota archaeon]
MTNDNCIRSEPWHILCRVRSQKGHCAAGHKEGDEVLFTGEEVKGKLCISVLYSMIPKVYAMMYNARFPWLKDQCVATHTCPDGFNPVMFELIRKDPE